MPYLLSDDTMNHLKRIIAKVDNLAGDGVTNDFNNIRIIAQAPRVVVNDQPTYRSMLIPVQLSQTGGSNGSKTTAPSYTYTAMTIDGVSTLGTVLSPTRPRSNGTYSAATYGTGYFGASGFVLFEAFETESTGGC